jgi:cysteine desulfurase
MDAPEIYLDNAATTRTDPDLAAALAEDMVRLYANPSSVHRPGLAAKRRLDESRAAFEALFGEGYRAAFTASGSEAINLAVKGAFARRRKNADRIVVSAVEHPAVFNSARDLARYGARLEVAPVAPAAAPDCGRADLVALERALAAADDVAVVAVMHVQNELGSANALDEVGRIVKARAPRALFLVDAVQGLGKLPVEPRRWQADAVAFASHKIHGPKGMGALLVKKGVDLEPLVSGGGQEGGLRSGTENVAGIAAFVRAACRAVDGLPANAARMAALRARLLARLRAAFGDDLATNGPADPAHGSPAILNVSIRGIPSEVLLHALEADGIYVSAGSACHSKSKVTSHVHEAVRMPAWRSESALRFGLSWHTTEAEIDRAAERTAARAAELRRLVKA